MNNTKLYVMANHDEIVGYDASHNEVFSLYTDPADKLMLNETLKFVLKTLGYKPKDCVFVTSDLVKTYFAKVIGMTVITPAEHMSDQSTDNKIAQAA